MALLSGFLVTGAEGYSFVVAATGWQGLRDYKMPAEASCAMCDILIRVIWDYRHWLSYTYTHRENLETGPLRQEKHAFA